MRAEPTFDDLRSAYRAANQFWTRSAKRHFRRLFPKSLAWPATFQHILAELEDEQGNYGLLTNTGETVRGFLSRLINHLVIIRAVAPSEVSGLSDFRDGRADLLRTPSVLGQVYLTKACLELSRHRRANMMWRGLPSWLALPSFLAETLTIHRIVEEPVNQPIGGIQLLCPIWMEGPDLIGPDAFHEQEERLKSLVDVHLTAAHSLSNLDYWNAVAALSARYVDLREAFQECRNRGNRDEHEELFVNRFEDYMRLIVIKTRR
jgi:hypothetical protein